MLVTVAKTVSNTVCGPQNVGTGGALPLSPWSENALLAGVVMFGPSGTVMVTISGLGWVTEAMLPGIVMVVPWTVIVLLGLVTVGPGTVTVIVSVWTGSLASKPEGEPVALIRGHEQLAFPWPLSSSSP